MVIPNSDRMVKQKFTPSYNQPKFDFTYTKQGTGYTPINDIFDLYYSHI